MTDVNVEKDEINTRVERAGGRFLVLIFGTKIGICNIFVCILLFLFASF